MKLATYDGVAVSGLEIQCPPEILALDPNAEARWGRFLKRTGIWLSSNSERVIDNESRRAWVISNLGIPSLVERLRSATSEVDRARIWWRESVACSAGDSEIPELSSKNLYLLNPFIVTEALKFRDPRPQRMAQAHASKDIERAEAIRRRGRPRKTAEEKRAVKAAQQRRFRARKRGSCVVGKIGKLERYGFSGSGIFPTTAAFDSTGLTGGEN
jgi:hypothetical protein